MKVRKKIFLVDDHKIFREGLSYLISLSDDYEVAGEAGDGHTFLKGLAEIQVDVVLMDISMPVINGLSAATEALEAFPALRIIILTMSCSSNDYNYLINAGVKGFLLKDSGKDELFRAIKAVCSGQIFYSQKFLQKMILYPENPFKEIRTTDLSPEENTFLRLLCEGATLNSIAGKLKISYRMVESIKSTLMLKTGTKNSTDLAVFALKNHLFG